MSELPFSGSIKRAVSGFSGCSREDMVGLGQILIVIYYTLSSEIYSTFYSLSLFVL